MLDVTCPWPCSLALGRVGCHHQRPRVCLLREYSAQRPQQRRSAVPSYQEILREGHVKALCELARNVAKRASPAHIVRVKYFDHCVEKLPYIVNGTDFYVSMSAEEMTLSQLPRPKDHDHPVSSPGEPSTRRSAC